MTIGQRVGLLLFIAGVVAFWVVPKEYMLIFSGMEIIGGVLFLQRTF